MNEFTIKELEQLSGIKAHTIRIWEQRYNFLKPRRTATNIRCYSCEELRTVLNIALLNKSGFKISHIGHMKPEEICQKILSLDDSQAAEEMVVNELVRYMATLDTLNFEKILDEQVCVRGMEHTILHIIFPFLDKLGILWQTGNITAAQEHLVSNIIRNKLIAAIETAKVKSVTGKSFLLFLPEGEHHELGLLFMHYMLKARGSNVIYLGANIPVKEASLLAKAKKPDFIFIHLSSAAIDFEKFIDELQKHMNGFQVVVSGQPARNYQKKPPPGISLKKSVAEVKDFLLSSN